MPVRAKRDTEKGLGTRLWKGNDVGVPGEGHWSIYTN